MSDQALVLSKPKEMLEYLQKAKSSITMALPAHLNPDRMLRLALTCFSTTPKLRECTANSIVASIVVASQLGLEPGVTGQGYLIPYGKTCSFIPGWQGLVGLLNNTGRATAWTGAVFEGDEWEFELGSSPKCKHRPGKNYGDTDKMIWVYACGKVNGSEQPVVEAWPISRVWRHRDRYNKVGQRHYSYENKEMYARKVVLLQVLKYLPRSVELNNAILAADAAEMGRTTRVEQGINRDESVIVEIDTEVEEKFTPKSVTPPAGTATKPADDDHPPGMEPKEDKSEGVKENAPTEALFDKTETARKPTATTTAKLKAPDWVSERDKPDLLNRLAKHNCTQAQLVGWLNGHYQDMFQGCKTVDDAEGFATKPLAAVLFKFDSIKDEIAAQPGKSAV